MWQEFTVSVTEEFTEHVYDGALSIEVYGHSSEEGQTLIGRSLADRWSEVSIKYLSCVGKSFRLSFACYAPWMGVVSPCKSDFTTECSADNL